MALDAVRFSRFSHAVVQLGHHRLVAIWRHHAAALDDTWIDSSVYGISLENRSRKNGRRWMPVFTFEIVRHGEAPVIADVLRLSDERAIWCHAEALALRIQNRDGAFIRVKNSEGATIVRTGIATALASIEKCSCVACPIKRELERCLSAGASRRD
jgi:hypothetical protein